MTQRYKMKVAYDGTNYAGWQIQADRITIQSEIERVLNTITQETPRIHGSGRTDAGVHAMGQIAHFDLKTPKPVLVLKNAMNKLLEGDIRIMNLEQTANDFHARYDVVLKEYRYLIWNGPILPPLLRQQRVHIHKKLDLAAMKSAADLLTGTHDFTAFSANNKCEVEDATRTLSKLEVNKRGYEISLIAQSNGFLYKMVRSLAGFLLRVGIHKVPVDSATELLNSKVRTCMVPTAPPEGLFLWHVDY